MQLRSASRDRHPASPTSGASFVAINVKASDWSRAIIAFLAEEVAFQIVPKRPVCTLSTLDRLIGMFSEQQHQVVETLPIAKMLALAPCDELVSRTDGDPRREAMRGLLNSLAALLQNLGRGALDELGVPQLVQSRG